MRPLRPRTIELASRDRLKHVEHLAPRFFREILGVDYEECLVTDESDLRDFMASEGSSRDRISVTLDRVESHYFIDCRNVGSTRIVAVLEFLASSGVTS